jgi:hypothetical protein
MQLFGPSRGHAALCFDSVFLDNNPLHTGEVVGLKPMSKWSKIPHGHNMSHDFAFAASQRAFNCIVIDPSVVVIAQPGWIRTCLNFQLVKTPILAGLAKPYLGQKYGASEKRDWKENILVCQRAFGVRSLRSTEPKTRACELGRAGPEIGF